jgi:hypothetical protein
MKNNAPCQGKQCPKGQVLIATTCQCISSQEKYKSPTKVDKSVKQISKEEYNKIRNLKNGGTMKTKKKMQSGGTSEGYPGSGLSKIASKMTPKAGAGYKNAVKGNPGREGRPASKGYDAYKKAAIERAGSEEAARSANYIKQKGGPTDGPSVSSKGAFYPDAKCRGEGCPKNPNDPKYKNQVAKLSAEDRKKIGVKYKTGGMVNANANLQAGKKAGSKGVKSGVNPKAAASKVAKGRSGGTSTAPKTAVPKAKYGMSITKMKKK